MKQVVRAFTLVATVVGIGAGIGAGLFDGPVRTVLGAIALVLLFTVVYCAASEWLERRGGKFVDIDAPPPETPLPESPVTEIYDPPSSRSASPKRTIEG
jgi:hypothetical protein